MVVKITVMKLTARLYQALTTNTHCVGHFVCVVYLNLNNPMEGVAFLPTSQMAQRYKEICPMKCFEIRTAGFRG